MREFAKKRPSDRIGIVSFGRNAYTRCPMTLDHALLEKFLEGVLRDWERAADSLSRKRATKGQSVETTPQEDDLQGTALGDGLVMAVSRLDESDAKSKIVILLSDGSSNSGETQPGPAGELASQLDVKVYTVGAGSNRPAPVATYNRLGQPVKRAMRFELDETTLREIAETTEGKYFHAQNRERLEEVYDEIDRLERVELKSKDFREWDEKFMPWALAALAVFLLETLLAATVLRTLP